MRSCLPSYAAVLIILNDETKGFEEAAVHLLRPIEVPAQSMKAEFIKISDTHDEGLKDWALCGVFTQNTERGGDP